MSEIPLRRLWGAVLPVLLVAVAPRIAAAQSQVGDGSDAVPRALAEALLESQAEMLSMFGLGGRSRIVVGSLPAGLAGRLWIPPGATILGGSESSGGSVAVLRSSLPPDSLTRMYRREQLARGWTRPPAAQSPPTQGFAPAPAIGGDDEDNTVFCSGSTSLTIAIEPVGNLRQITARASGLGPMACRAPRPESMSRFERPTYPTLVNPPGTGSGFRQSCGEWNSTGRGGATRLETSMTLVDILSHYARQLADSGWTPVGEPRVVTRSWTRRDSTGTFSELTLTARTPASMQNCVEVEMGVNSRVPPR